MHFMEVFNLISILWFVILTLEKICCFSSWLFSHCILCYLHLLLHSVCPTFFSFVLEILLISSALLDISIVSFCSPVHWFLPLSDYSLPYCFFGFALFLHSNFMSWMLSSFFCEESICTVLSYLIVFLRRISGRGSIESNYMNVFKVLDR